MLLRSRVTLQCKKAERHISGMMIMDEGVFNLVQQQQHSQHVPPSPWHLAMSVGGVGRNGASMRSMDGANSTHGNVDVD